jgi:conjugative transfer signal peptidase TraF
LKRKFAIFYVLVTLLCFATCIFILFHALGYRVNRSASLPFLIYIVTPLEQNTEIKRGDYVLIDLSRVSNPVISRGIERGYVNLREPMLKQIGGIPGDTVVLIDDFLYLDGEVKKKVRIIVASHDSYGGELSAWPTPITLQLGQYWLVSDPERGFDSRYFGPINRSAFTHMARPVF